jgi:respiratory nitrate reductase gamma subunit
MIPASFTDAVGMSESTYRWFSAVAGAVAGAICVVGFFGLAYRRATNARVRRTTSRTDLLVYLLLVVLIVLGCWMTFAHNLITSSPYDYRESVSEWWRSLFILQPDVEAVTNANVVYQVHAIVAWGFWALFPFSRLVHAWSIPLQYLGRPYILYRRRYPERVR